MIYIKSADEIALMKESGNILAELLRLMEKVTVEGATTYDVDKIAYEFIKKNKAKPSFLNYEGFPSSLCISIDEQVVHGIPSKKKKIENGQLVSVDAGVYFKGFHTDAARTFAIGKVSDEKLKLKEVTEQSFFAGIKFAKEGNRIVDISRAVSQTAESNGFSVVTQLVGHGVGRNLHEDPSVPNYVAKFRGIELKSGMTLAIEPMINLGVPEVDFSNDGWTVTTRDKKPSAHYENTVVITKDECEIITL